MLNISLTFFLKKIRNILLFSSFSNVHFRTIQKDEEQLCFGYYQKIKEFDRAKSIGKMHSQAKEGSEVAAKKL